MQMYANLCKLLGVIEGFSAGFWGGRGDSLDLCLTDASDGTLTSEINSVNHEIMINELIKVKPVISSTKFLFHFFATDAAICR